MARRKMYELNEYKEGISNKDYHGLKDFVSSSQFKKAMDDHTTFLYYQNNKVQDEPWSPSKTNAKDLGSLVHTLLLEPHELENEFIFINTHGVNFRNKEGQVLKAKYIAMAKKEGKILLKTTDLAVATKMVASVRAHPFAWKLLTEKGKSELSGFYESNGVKQRIRPDRLSFSRGIVDVKTIEDIEQFEYFARHVWHYDLSAYQYKHGHKLITGEDVDFWFVVVERTAPYRVEVRRASELFLKRGQKKYNKAVANVLIARDKEYNPERYQQADYRDI